jgi:hypothetical protein
LPLFYFLFFVILILLPRLGSFLKQEFPESENEGSGRLMPYRFCVLTDYDENQAVNREYLSIKTTELSKKAQLTPREAQVLILLFEKQDNDMIAGLLVLCNI